MQGLRQKAEMKIVGGSPLTVDLYVAPNAERDHTSFFNKVTS